MKYLDLLQMYFERTNAFDTLWTIYVTMVGAVLAFFATRDRLDRRVLFIIMIGFLAFSMVNLSALCDTVSVRNGLQRAIQSYVPSPDEGTSFAVVKESVGDRLQQQPIAKLILFHLGCDMLIVAMMWIITRAKTRSRTGTAAGVADAVAAGAAK